MTTPIRVALLVSGGGRTLENMVERSRQGALPAEVVLAVSSDPAAKGVERAKRLGVPARVVERRAFGGDVAAFSREVFAQVEAARADLVCLGGFLCLLRVPAAWRGRVLNIHPALVPAFSGRGFYGEKVHEAVIASGAKVTGCTVHFCDDEYDHGPIVLQRVVPVLDDDTAAALADRVFEAEKEAYPEAVRLFAEGRLAVEGRRVRVASSGERPAVAGVRHVSCPVKDVKRAVAFYGDALGLRVRESSDAWATLDGGGIALALRRSEGGAPAGRAGAVVAFAAPDLGRAVEKLRASGAKLLGNVDRAPLGSVVAFEDPDGNVLELVAPART